MLHFDAIFPVCLFRLFFHFVKHFQYSKSTHFDFSETHKRNEQNKYRIIKSVFFIWCAKHESDFNNTFHTYHAHSHIFCFFFVYNLPASGVWIIGCQSKRKFDTKYASDELDHETNKECNITYIHHKCMEKMNFPSA